MKFIVFQYNKTEERPFEIYTMPDTALHINKRPFFIPDYASPCVMHVHQAVRVCRLGRNISQRFAHRYIDAVTLCTRLEAPSLPPTVGRCFDECLSVGEWIAKEEGNFQSIEEAAERAIAEVSKYFTMRQGDIILLDEVSDAEEVHIDQHVEKVLEGKTVIQFNIK